MRAAIACEGGGFRFFQKGEKKKIGGKRRTILRIHSNKQRPDAKKKKSTNTLGEGVQKEEKDRGGGLFLAVWKEGR